MNNVELIAVVEAKCAASAGKTLAKRLELAMKSAAHHWLVTNEGSQFNAAVAAVMQLSEGDDLARLKDEIDGLSKLNAVLMAAQAGLTVNLEGMREPKNPIGLIDMWKKIKEMKQ